MRVGYHHSPETIEKMRLSNMGKKRSNETRKRISLAKLKINKWKGENNPNYKGKISKGHKVSDEHKEKVRKLMLGRKITWKDKISVSRIGKFTGVNSPRWNGGTSFFPYTTDWSETLRRSIRERDKYICQLCNKPQGDIAHDVHHIDYDKNNCNPNNLITLCHSCHSKTNSNREYWKKHLPKTML